MSVFFIIFGKLITFLILIYNFFLIMKAEAMARIPHHPGTAAPGLLVGILGSLYGSGIRSK